AVAVLAELLTRAYPCPPLTPRIPAAAGHPEHAAHCFDAELSLYESQLYNWRSKQQNQQTSSERELEMSTEIARLKRQLAE
ncbi:hypothetical protein QU845_25350, partial [Escherichia coli]|nr:hypothetical protein [Escherichia coli]